MAQETQAEAGSTEDEPANTLEPGLHLLATPIGSAGDLSLRGRDALRSAEILVCEDTRVLRKLMDLHDAPLGRRALLTYHEHNADAARPKIMGLLAQGRSVLLASDAGTPLIADPGYKLVRAARKAGYRVSALPGPCAAVTALVLSGLPTDAFCFIGFPPPRSAARKRAFERWASAPGSVILYESPRRLAATLQDAAAVFGVDREIAVARELTKRFEEVRSGLLGAIAQEIAAAEPLKGEVVVVIGPPGDAAVDADAVDALLRTRLQSESVKDAVKEVVRATGAPKNVVYARALAIKGTNHENGE